MTLLPIYKNLRTRILECMGDILGTYTFANGDFVPAIAIDDKGIYPPAGTKVQGLEVSIIPAVAANSKPLIGGCLIDHQSKLILKQWDSTRDTLEATIRLTGILGNRINIGPRILPVSSIGNIESRTITFFDAQITRL